MNPTRATDPFAANTPDLTVEAETTLALADQLAASHAALEERFVDIAVLGAEIARLETELAQKSAEIDTLSEQIDQGKPGGLQPDQAELIIGELSRQLDLRDRTLTEVIADRDRVVLMVEEIFGTTSWKATAPLRKLKGMLRGPGQS